MKTVNLNRKAFENEFKVLADAQTASSVTVVHF